jgi:hypothetical protein
VFFCVNLTILTPLVVLVQMGALSGRIYSYARINASRALYGIVVGIALWMKRPIAIFLLRIYFILTAAVMVVSFLRLVAFAQRTHVSVLLVRGAIPVMTGCGIALLWFAYFRKSVRVRNTYGANV